LKVGSELFAAGSVAVRLLLLFEGQEVGRAGMAVDAEFDRGSATVTAVPGKAVSVAMVLLQEGAKKVRLVALDPATDAVLAQSSDIEVKLGI